MEMTFQQYIDNPLGKNNAVFSQRDLFRSLYTDKFDKLVLREAGKIDFTLYIDKNHDKYVAHIKIPSETVNKFYYDAVIYFYSNDPACQSSNTLTGYNVKFFSNDPAFVFTYLRVFLKNNMFFEDMKPKSSKLALKKDPKIKNPYEIPGYSKILYFAFLFMKSKNLFNKSWYEQYGTKYSASELLKHVEHTDKKIAERQELGKEIEKQRIKKEKESKSESHKAHVSEVESANERQRNLSGVEKVKTVSKALNTQKVKQTQKTKKIKR